MKYLRLLLRWVRLLGLDSVDLGLLHIDCMMSNCTAAFLHELHELVTLLHTKRHVGLAGCQSLRVDFTDVFVAHSNIFLLVAFVLPVEHP